MKFNWGTGAFMFFGGFAIFMTCLAIFAAQQSNELVTDDYYEKELEFEEVQRKQEITSLLSEQLTWKIENNQFSIDFPKEIEGEISGNIVFFKPSNEKDDQQMFFITTSNNHTININNFSVGMYKVKIEWSANGVEYYNDGGIVIP